MFARRSQRGTAIAVEGSAPAGSEAGAEPEAGAGRQSGPVPAPLPGSPLFDPGWYCRHQVASGADPREDYIARGWRAARSPCPLFSPSWYLARNPDVALSGQEPLQHWLMNGQHEGRDPCGLFSLAHYRAIAPEATPRGDPLSAYLSGGRAAGLRPHPKTAPFDPGAPDLGIVVAFEGDERAADLALYALSRHAGTMPITVYLVDNAPPGERGALDIPSERLRAAGLGVERLSEPASASLLGRLNAGIWAAQRSGRHSHIALLGQETLVPDGLFTALVDLWAPIAAPVLNLASTAQAVPAGFDIYASSAPLEALAAAAARRREAIPGAVQLVEALEPACILFEAGTLDALGLLDETAASAAEAVAALLAGCAGLGIAEPVVARHLYAHRLERSALHARVAMRPARAALARIASAQADRRAIAGWSPASAALIEAQGRAEAAAIGELAAALDAAEGKGREAEAHAPVRLPGDRSLAPGAVLAHGAPIGERSWPAGRAERRLQRAAWRALVRDELASFAALEALQPLIAALAGLFAKAPPVLVLTMDTDPVTGDEKDGYVQRVIAIDRALAPLARIYLRHAADRDGAPALVFLGDGIWRLEIAHRCRLGEAILRAVLEAGATVYSQSLVGIDPPAVRRLLPQRSGRFVMDMHGAVPEEFVLYANHYMAQKYGAHELWAARHADLVVCVTAAMAEHFRAKLGIAPERMIVCPIHLGRDEARRRRAYNSRPRAIYAGGTQRWQCIPELASAVAETAGLIDWCLLTPDVAGMRQALARAGAPLDGSGVEVRAASQAQVFRSYGRADLGLLLRKDCVVNRVACPTKLVEYLRFGVVPVLSSPHIGDFAELGMRHLSVEALLAGEVPGPDALAEMAAANALVHDRLLARSAEGLARIAEAAAGGAVAEPEPLRSTA